MLWLVWLVPLVVLTFLWALTEQIYRGPSTFVSGCLTWAIFGTCAAVFFLSGWKDGLIAFLGAFALGAVFHWPAQAIAKWYARDSDSMDLSRRDPELNAILEDFSSKGLKTLIKRRQSHQGLIERAIDFALTDPEIRSVLAEHGCDRKDLIALGQRIELYSAPPDMRVEAICNPALVDFFLIESDPVVVDGNYARDLKSEESSLLLLQWATERPSERPPSL